MKIKDMPLDAFPLHPQLINALKLKGISTIGEALKLSRHEMLMLKGVGHHSVEQFEKVCEMWRLKWKNKYGKNKKSGK